MKLQVQQLDHVTILSPAGDMVADASDQFRRAALEHLDQNARDFVVDLAGLDTVDSRGLESFIWLDECATERLGQVRLAAPPETLSTVFEITRLQDRWPIDDTVDQAVANLQVGAPVP
ncbi:MAG: STAS domain-containing protein [Planctomycetota bacterium]